MVILQAQQAAESTVDTTTIILLIVFIAIGIFVLISNKYRALKKLQKQRDNEQNKAQVGQTNTETVESSVSKTAENNASPKNDAKEAYVRPEGCCGLHDVCEMDFLNGENVEIVYFEDEELDAYAGRDADDYNSDEIAEFEDVLLTLKENEVPEWLKSLKLRKINLPQSVMDEALMIISDIADNNNNSQS